LFILHLVYSYYLICSQILENWYNVTYHPQTGGLALCDQPLTEVGLGEEHEISKNEFENIWNQALKNIH
jgi:hypothetical protein